LSYSTVYPFLPIITFDKAAYSPSGPRTKEGNEISPQHETAHRIKGERGETVNILHLNRFFYAGQTTQVFSLIRHQKALGIQPFLVMDGDPSYQDLTLYRDQMKSLGVATIKPGDQSALSELIRHRKIDLVHAHCSLTYPLACAAAAQLRVPLVMNCHGPGMGRQDIWPYLSMAQTIICSSQRVAGSLRDFQHKTRVIPHGVDVESIRPGPKVEPVKIAYVSRVDRAKDKGYSQFCKAVDLLEGVDVYVAANRTSGSKTAQYLSPGHDIPALLANTDIVAGSGKSLLEAMAAGNAALILGRTYQGILTPEKAARQQLPDLSGLSGHDPCYKNIFYDLAKLAQNKLYLRQLQAFGRELAEREYDQKALAAKVTEIYRQLLS
jgi:hypothetical protein